MIELNPAVFQDCNDVVQKVNIICTYDNDAEKEWLQEHVQLPSDKVEISYIPRCKVYTKENISLDNIGKNTISYLEHDENGSLKAVSKQLLVE